MKWISKYNFLDLYKRKISNNMFNPGSGLSIEKIVVPDENTIVLAGEKKLWEFNDDPNADSCVVLFVSKDKGKSYKEVLVKDNYLERIESSSDFTLFTTYTKTNGVSKYHTYLLDNNSLKITEIDEYLEDDAFYSNFDGKFYLFDKKGEKILVNAFDKKENYKIPQFLLNEDYVYLENKVFLYLKGREVLVYNIETRETTLLKNLIKEFDTFNIVGSEIILMIFNKRFDKIECYDLNENKLYEETNETKYYYYYKNFVCDYTNLGASPSIRYSYDYGNTWTTHNVTEFSILQNVFGFYKDHFLVTEGVFWHGDSSESGGRIMVGEFVKVAD